ncbi:FkbM family methyltransferase [uncultured Algibacter sp.]|uniref:FkbM family methyltransferase n=1 Tax=uncultured Algibacter sp. TaxID=298659 RepID=UPI0026126EB2|nr:FkbM family methyltransferase [uncultured Algibacter sp.]
MKKIFRNTINWVLRKFGFTTLSIKNLDMLVSKRKIAEEYIFLQKYPVSLIEKYLKYKTLSNAQLKQDLFALMESKFKQDGYFVEFGATNGISLSNTYLLEKEFNWIGILAEPSKYWHGELALNRQSIIDKRCVWKDSGEKLAFVEVENAILSTVKGFGEDDAHSERRKDSISYTVESISLNDLLDYHKAPKIIDYLSIDTEGSELVILEGFDFTKYKFRSITVEHNFSKNRSGIYKLLTNAGYERVFEDFSSYDDWYKLKE